MFCFQGNKREVVHSRPLHLMASQQTGANYFETDCLNQPYLRIQHLTSVKQTLWSQRCFSGTVTLFTQAVCIMVQTGISNFMRFNDGQPVYRDDATNEVTVFQKHQGPRGHWPRKGVWGCAALKTPFSRLSCRSQGSHFKQKSQFTRPPFEKIWKF